MYFINPESNARLCLYQISVLYNGERILTILRIMMLHINLPSRIDVYVTSTNLKISRLLFIPEVLFCSLLELLRAIKDTCLLLEIWTLRWYYRTVSFFRNDNGILVIFKSPYCQKIHTKIFRCEILKRSFMSITMFPSL